MISVDVDHVIEVLNRIHQADPTVLPALINYRVPCNENVVNDPTVQVHYNGPLGAYDVGFLGVLNGIFGIRDDGWGYIAASLDEKGAITGFRSLSV